MASNETVAEIAQEMREDDVRIGAKEISKTRCEDLKARLPYPPNGDDVWWFKKLNYILRGDAGKE